MFGGNVEYIVLDEEEKNRMPKESKLIWKRNAGFVDLEKLL